MKNYKIHFNYDNNYLYSNQKFDFKNKIFITQKSKNYYQHFGEIKNFYSNNFKKFNKSKIFKNKKSHKNSKIKNLNKFSKIHKYKSKNHRNKRFKTHNYSNITFNKLNKNIYNYYLKSRKIHFRKIKKFKNRNFKNKKFDNKNSENEYNDNLWIYSFLSEKLKEEPISKEPTLEEIPIPYRDLAEVFSKQEADKLPPHRITDCKIVLQKDATLHYGPIYSLTEEESKLLEEYIKENLEKGFIRPSESPAGYPVVFQKKKDSTLRVCIDYKKLNEVTIRNSNPIPLITDIIGRVKGAKYFTKLDLRSAYNLIRIREGDEYKTAFRTKFGHYEYLDCAMHQQLFKHLSIPWLCTIW